jgi:nitrate/nitrite-specific signal transduction histidine kinase
MGLEVSMAQHASRLMEKTGITINLDVPDSISIPNEDCAIVLLSTYKEALNNASKHSKSQEVWVRLQSDQQHYELEIRDEGRGFIKPKRIEEMELDGHYGLVMMKERMEKSGGHLEVHSEVGRGTIVRAWGTWEEDRTGEHETSDGTEIDV